MVTSTDARDWAQVAALAEAVQAPTADAGEVAFVDRGYTGEVPAGVAAAEGIRLAVVKLPEAKRGFILVPRRWVVARSFAQAARFRRPAREYERPAETLKGLHLLTCIIVMLCRFVTLMANYAKHPVSSTCSG